MYGSEMESFYVYWEVGSTRSQLFGKSGQQHTSDTDEWDLATVDMTNYAGQTGKLVIVAIIYANGDYRSDAAFCDFSLSGTAVNTTPSDWRTSSSSSTGNSRSSALAFSTTVNPGGTVSRRWNITSGATPSSNTGPDKHHDNSSSSSYIYYEASGGSTSIARGYIIRSLSSYTV
tara:strand:+ start:30 stop:551 length:522 start_codon:yes stop_codon:yes gene_type:complete